MIANVMTGTYVRKNENGEETQNFHFYTNLSALDKLVFVDSVVETLIDDTHYNSIVRDLIFDFNIVAVFTDIDTSFINIRDDDNNAINPIIFIEQFLEETNVVDIVKANIDDGLLEELNGAVDKSIEYRTGIHTNPLKEALTSLVNSLERKVDGFDLGNIMNMVQLFSGMTEDFTTQNVVDAYLNSDAHKDNLIEIEEAKK